MLDQQFSNIEHSSRSTKNSHSSRILEAHKQANAMQKEFQVASGRLKIILQKISRLVVSISNNFKSSQKIKHEEDTYKFALKKSCEIAL